VESVCGIYGGICCGIFGQLPVAAWKLFVSVRVAFWLLYFCCGSCASANALGCGICCGICDGTCLGICPGRFGQAAGSILAASWLFSDCVLVVCCLLWMLCSYECSLLWHMLWNIAWNILWNMLWDMWPAAGCVLVAVRSLSG
jgi:hypothetical protein